MSSFLRLFSGHENTPFIISGPCSAETEEQVLKTAEALKKTQRIDVFRAGAWKARTKPTSFEGKGETALKWIQRVKQEYQIPVCTEVAKAEHVELCLKHDIDMIWIGARTTVSPFSVQEIAEALKGTNIPVLVKNPISPDLFLWAGAIERLDKAGVKHIAAVHRGFSWFDRALYRYTPKWEVPIELKTLFPELPILCDPSHIAGNRELLFNIAQKALDLNMDGLMIESHINPEEALSDAKQQLTPYGLDDLLRKLVYRKAQDQSPEADRRLNQLRAVVDDIDEQIIQKLFERMELSKRLGEHKQKQGLTVFQLERWHTILKTRSEWAKNADLNEDFIKALWQLIHQESIRYQTEIFEQSRVSEALETA